MSIDGAPQGEAPDPMRALAARMVVALTDNTQLLGQVTGVLGQLCDLLEGVKNQYGIIDFLQGVEDKPGLMVMLGELVNEVAGVKDEFWCFNRAMEILKENNEGQKPSWSDFCIAYFGALDDDEKRRKEEEEDDDDDDGDDWKKGKKKDE